MCINIKIHKKKIATIIFHTLYLVNGIDVNFY